MNNCQNCPVNDGYKPAEAVHQIAEPKTQQPEALRLAQHLEQFRSFPDDLAAAKELRRLHAENEALKKDAARWRAVTRDDEYCGYVVVNNEGSRDCALYEHDADLLVDAAIAAQAKQGGA